MNEDLLLDAMKEAVTYWYHQYADPFNPPLWVMRLKVRVERNTLLKFDTKTCKWVPKKGRKK